MNAQHSAETGEWYTPPRWTGASARALGGIDYDPCSSAAANTIVGATHYHTAGNNVLELAWHTFARTAFDNPPGSCIVDGVYTGCGSYVSKGKRLRTKCSCALPHEFMAKSMIEAWHGMDIIYLAYSVNQLRQITRLGPPPELGVSIAMPADRIPYIDPATMEPQRGTNCDSAFIMFSKQAAPHTRFADVFKGEGCEVYARV